MDEDYCKLLRWLGFTSAEIIAKPLYGLTPVPRVRIPPSPPDSLDCREFPAQFPAKYVNYARFLRFLHEKPDCGERTTVANGALVLPFSLHRQQTV